MNVRLPILASALLAASLCVPARAQVDQDAPAPPATDNDPAGAELEPAAPGRVASIVLANDRQAPADYVRDILVLLNLGEGQFAKPLMDELAGLQLSDEQRAGLVARVGTAKIHKLARSPELGPEAREFVVACVTAAGAASTSPEKLAAVIEQLGSDDAATRRAGLAGLRAAGEQGVVATLGALAASDDATQQNRLREALVRMKPLANPIVAAALDAPSDATRRQAAWALGQMDDRPSLPRLAAIAGGPDYDQPLGKAARWSLEKLAGADFSPAAAAPLLEAAIEQSTGGVPARRADNQDAIAVWGWDAEANAPAKTLLPRELAGQVRTARLTSDLWGLNQGDAASNARALAYRLQAEWLQSDGGRVTLPGPAVDDADATTLNAALDLALSEGLTGAAILAADAMGARRDPAVLMSVDAQPTPLAAALTADHPAVRFAALRAVMAINPPSPFPGSSRVAAALMYFASSDGESAAVIAMPKTVDAATFSGRLAGAGIQGLATNVGAQVVCQAVDHPDIEFVVLDMGILRPVLRETLFRVRRQTSTAMLPVVLLAADGQLDHAKQVAREHDRVLTFPRPHSSEDTVSIAAAARAAAPPGMPSADERAEQAAAAAGWIEDLLSEGPSFYNLRGRSDELLAAVNRSSDIASTLPSLALVGTPDSQRTLANLASQDVLPIATRDAAAAAFDKSVQQHGLLLTSQEIVDQYDRYNASEQSDAQTQRVLGAVLDTIESLRDDPVQQGS